MARTYKWNPDPMTAAIALNPRNVAAGALLVEAKMAAESLLYLHDLDSGTVYLGHNSQVAEVGIFRWAAVTAITSLDLAAAAVFRLANRHPGGDYEADVRECKKIPGKGGDWARAVWTDSEYQLIVAARNPMTHRRLLTNQVVGSPDRTKFRVKTGNGEVALSSADLIEKAIAVTTRWLERLASEILIGTV